MDDYPPARSSTARTVARRGVERVVDGLYRLYDWTMQPLIGPITHESFLVGLLVTMAVAVPFCFVLAGTVVLTGPVLVLALAYRLVDDTIGYGPNGVDYWGEGRG